MTNTKEVIIPRYLNAKGAFDLCDALGSVEKADKYAIDFGHLFFVEPFGALLAGQALRSFAVNQRSNGIRTVAVNCRRKIKKSDPRTYLAHIGFFRFCGVSVGNRPGDARANQNYQPIQTLSVANLQRDAGFNDVQDVIELKANDLAKLLIQNSDNEMEHALSYMIREALRNALEHSESKRIYYCAQCWPTKDRAQIAILDSRIGVKASLQKNSIYRHIETDVEAIKKSTEAGVSRMPLGASSNTGKWDNSGFGLYMLKRLCGDAGDLLVSSGGAAVSFRQNEVVSTHANCHGTRLKIEIHPNRLAKLGTLSEILYRYSNESGVKAKPSASSLAAKY